MKPTRCPSLILAPLMGSLTGILTVILTLILTLILTACAPAPPLTAETDTPPEAPSNAPADSSAVYQALIEELEAALLALKGQNYSLRVEYESKLRELEAEIAALKALLREDDPTVSPDVPVSGTPETAAPSRPTSPPSPPPPPFLYEIRNGQAAILRYTGTETAVEIPPSIEACPVTTLGEAAFRGTAVTAVTLPDTVTSLGWFAFADCPSLAAVTLPASVAFIGYGAFDGCPRVTLYCPPDSYAASYADSFGLPRAPLPNHPERSQP